MINQLYDIFPSKPFGRGTVDATITSDPNTRTNFTGTIGSYTPYLNTAILNNGDLCLLHQTYGVSSLSEDNWEPNYVVSGGGTNSPTLFSPLGRTYVAGAQVIKVPEYNNLTISSGFGGKSYGATVATNTKNAMGGINAIAVAGTLNLNAVIHQNGYQGYISSDDRGGMDEWQNYKWWYDNAPSGGHPGGVNSTDGSNAGVGGNSLIGYDSTETQAPKGNGGGGGTVGDRCGGGGGNALYGANSSESGGGYGGLLAGVDTLSSCHLGGGGGGPHRWNGGGGAGIWTGSSGGGIWYIWAKNIITGVSGGIQSNGGTAFANNDHGGGSGAGGSILINCQIADIGVDKISAIGGTNYAHSGKGSLGRVRINYGSTLSGSVNSSLASVSTFLNERLKTQASMIQIIG